MTWSTSELSVARTSYRSRLSCRGMPAALAPAPMGICFWSSLTKSSTCSLRRKGCANCTAPSMALSILGVQKPRSQGAQSGEHPLATTACRSPPPMLKVRRTMNSQPVYPPKCFAVVATLRLVAASSPAAWYTPKFAGGVSASVCRTWNLRTSSFTAV